MNFLDAMQGVLAVLIMFVLGYILSARGWFDERSKKLISKLVVSVSLPAYMFSNIMSKFDRQMLRELIFGLAVPYLSIIVSYFLGYLIARVIKIPKNRQGIFCVMFAFSNTIFIGLPVNLALFGEQSVPYVLLYYMANTTLFWGFAVHMISKDAYGKRANRRKFFTKENISGMFSPPIRGFSLALVFILAGIKASQIPAFIMDSCKYIGSMTTPLSMIFIGIAMQSIKLSDIKIDKGMVAVIMGRVLIVPALAAAMSAALGLPMLMKNVFIIQAAMPAMTLTSIVAERYGADYKYAALVTTVSNIVSLLSIPVIILLQ